MMLATVKRRRATIPKLAKIKVLELPHASGVYLGITPETRGVEIRSSLQVLAEPRELDDYHLCGVYHCAGVPVEVQEIALGEETQTNQSGYRELTAKLSSAVNHSLRAGSPVFVTGGTCVQAPGIAGGMRQAFGKQAKLGIIWLDAHGDLNIPETSRSGMLGGMPFATIIGFCLDEWRDSCGLEPPFDPSCALISDARSFDKEEADNVNGSLLTMIDTDHFNDKTHWKSVVADLASKVDAIYLHIDADIVDARFLPSVNTPEPNGPDIWTVMQNITTVMDTGKVAAAALASIYFDTQGRGKERNIENQIAILSGLRMIATLFNSWQSCVLP